jgi:hypothetical protein
MTKIELLSNATTIDSALNYIRNKQQSPKPKQQEQEQQEEQMVF